MGTTPQPEDRTGLTLEEIHERFSLLEHLDGSLSYAASIGVDGAGRDWADVALSIGSIDRIGPFARARRGAFRRLGASGRTPFGDRIDAGAAARDGNGVLLESDDGQYTLFVPTNLLKPLFAHRWLVSDASPTPADGWAAGRVDAPEMEPVTKGADDARTIHVQPSLAELRRALGSSFRNYGPLFVTAPQQSLFGPAAGSPDIEFARRMESLRTTVRQTDTQLAERAPYRLEPNAELRVTTSVARPMDAVFYDAPPAMPAGRVPVPFAFRGSGYLEYDASDADAGSIALRAGRPVIKGDPVGQTITLQLTAPQGLRRGDGPHGPWDLRNAVDILAAPLEVNEWKMYVGTSTRGAAPSGLQPSWTNAADEDRVVFDGERFRPVAEVKSEARSRRSAPDYCMLNYHLDRHVDHGALKLDGEDVTAALAGKGIFRGLAFDAQDSMSELRAGSPEAAVVKTVKELAEERARIRGGYRGAGSWGEAAAELDAPKAFSEKTGEKRDDREIRRWTGVDRVEMDIRTSSPEEKPQAPALLGAAAAVPPIIKSDVYYNIQYMLPTQAPLRGYGPGDGDGKWEAWAAAGADGVFLTRSGSPASRAGYSRASAAETEGGRADSDWLFGREGVRGGGSVGEGLGKGETRFLANAFNPGGAGSAAAGMLPMAGLDALGGSEVAFSGSGAASSVMTGEVSPGASPVRAFPVSMFDGGFSVSDAGSAGAEIRYQAPELSALRSGVRAAGFDLESPGAERPEDFTPTSFARPGEGGAAAELGIPGDATSDLGFVPRGAATSNAFGGTTGGIAPEAAGGLFGGSGLMMAGGLAMTAGFGGAALALGTGVGTEGGGFGSSLFDSPEMATVSGEPGGIPGDTRSDRSVARSESPRPRGGSMFAGKSMFIDYSDTDKTLYMTRFNKGSGPSGRRDVGVHIPEGLGGGVVLSSSARSAAHTAAFGRSVPVASVVPAETSRPLPRGGLGYAVRPTVVEPMELGGGDGGTPDLSALGGSAGTLVPVGMSAGTDPSDGPPLANDTRLKVRSPALNYYMGEDGLGEKVMFYRGQASGAAYGYPGSDGAEVGMMFPIGMDAVYAGDVSGMKTGDMHVAWEPGRNQPENVSGVHKHDGMAPSLMGFPVVESTKVETMTGLLMESGGVVGSTLAAKAQADGVLAADRDTYRGVVDGIVGSHGPSVTEGMFAGGSEPMTARRGRARKTTGTSAADMSLLALAGGEGFGGSIGGAAGAGFGTSTLSAAALMTPGARLPKGGSPAGALMNPFASGSPTMASAGAVPYGHPGKLMNPFGPAAAGPRVHSGKIMDPFAAGATASVKPGAGAGLMDPFATHKPGKATMPGKLLDPFASTTSSSAKLAAAGHPSAGALMTPDFSGKSLVADAGVVSSTGGRLHPKIAATGMVVARPSLAQGDVGDIPDKVIKNGRVVSAHTASSKRNPAGASTENKVNLDYDFIAREILQRIKRLASLQRERRADDHMRYG